MSAGRPLRVLQVVQRFHPELGGLETHVAEVTRRLAAHPDVEVTVLTTDRSGALPRVDEVGGVRVLRRRSWSRHGEEYFAPGIVPVIRRGGWDLVHVQGSQTTVPTVAMTAALSARIPYVVTFHSGGHSSSRHGWITRVQNRLNRPLLRRAAALVAVSRFERERFRRITGLPASSFQVIANGGALPAAAADVAPVRGAIVTSGRLEQYKGHHRAIAALAAVRREMPEATLTVLGSGPYDAELRALTGRLGLQGAVTFRHLPPGERSAMATVLRESSVMAAFSTYEAHPVAVMEAVAIGLPVVGFDVAGIGDLVEDGWVTGVAPEASDDRLAAALLERMRAADGAPHAAPDFPLPTWEGAADALLDLYRRVAARPRRVVQVITTLTSGGAERQLESLVTRSRHRQHVIALYGGGLVAESLAAAGVRVDVLALGGARRLLALPLLTARLLRLRPDVVQVHLLSGQLWGLPAARLARVPRVLSTEHSLMDDSIENRPLTRSLRLLHLALSRLADRTIAVSATTAARLTRWGVPADRIDVVDNGIDFDALAFDPASRARVRAELGVADGVLLVGAVGRLEAVKRFGPLLAALAPTLAVGRRELVIAGDGPLRDALRAQAARLGVTSAVHVTGPRADVPALLSAFDVQVSPSRDETFGLAALEGIAAGLPVVYAQCPALDGFADTCPGAVPIGIVPEGWEAETLRVAVDSSAELAADGRLTVPRVLVDAYDIRATTARMDEIAAGGRRTR